MNYLQPGCEQATKTRVASNPPEWGATIGIRMSEINVNCDRLWGTLMDMGKIGALPNGGCCRAALSEEDKHGRDQFIAWCRAAGCDVVCDAVGNVYARRAGRDANRPAAATGSHLDTQPHGGKFDGVYGVLAGLEVVRALNDAQITTCAPIDVICWTNEEGVRFGPPLAGSLAFAGVVDVRTVHNSPTIDGSTVGDDLRKWGFLGTEKPGSRALDCFVEAHIEQGPILEARATQIGVVTHIVGIRWSIVQVTGCDSHAGTTPMDKRRDALLGAAAMITALNQIARQEDEFARLTVGKMEISPNSGATIPGGAKFVCDLRHPDAKVLDSLELRMHATMRKIAAEQGLQISIEGSTNIAPLKFTRELIDTVRNAADHLNYSNIDMLSGAGHDAMNIARKVPTAMIFVPCKDGLSHNEAESATPEDLAAGAHTLLHTLLARAGRA
jgi:N-carbamoyl-L-amino-acid hydrolase